MVGLLECKIERIVGCFVWGIMCFGIFNLYKWRKKVNCVVISYLFINFKGLKEKIKMFYWILNFGFEKLYMIILRFL